MSSFFSTQLTVADSPTAAADLPPTGSALWQNLPFDYNSTFTPSPPNTFFNHNQQFSTFTPPDPQNNFQFTTFTAAPQNNFYNHNIQFTTFTPEPAAENNFYGTVPMGMGSLYNQFTRSFVAQNPNQIVGNMEAYVNNFNSAPTTPPPTSPKKKNKVQHWTKEEHMLFLIGLQEFGEGDWRRIAKVVGTKSPIQVGSHGQKYFKRLRGPKQNRKRSSIHHITTVDPGSMARLLAGRRQALRSGSLSGVSCPETLTSPPATPFSVNSTPPPPLCPTFPSPPSTPLPPVHSPPPCPSLLEVYESPLPPDV